MIHPILPISPFYPSVPSTDINTALILNILLLSTFIVVSLFVTLLMSRYASIKWNGKKKQTMTIFLCITGIIAVFLFGFFGLAVGAVRGMIFCLILVLSSYSDIKVREADDYLHIMITLTALIGAEISDIPSMALGAAALAIPMIIIAAFSKGNGVGGADIKLSAACGFLLGAEKGIVGLVFGLILGIVINFIIQRIKKKADSFPLIPYLAVGYMAAYFI